MYLQYCGRILPAMNVKTYYMNGYHCSHLDDYRAETTIVTHSLKWPYQQEMDDQRSVFLCIIIVETLVLMHILACITATV